MTTTAQIDAFLACKRIGLAGVSSSPDHFSRQVFREFVARGYDVVPINPLADEIEGRRAFATVVDAAPLDAVLIMTPPEATESIVRDAHRAGVRRVWMHRGVGAGSVDWNAKMYARAHGIDAIVGECPLMFLPNGHAIHRAHGGLRRTFGHYPDVTDEPAPRRWGRALGHGAVAWTLATWAVLVIAGIFAWRTGLAARLLVIPASFALLAWLHRGPGRLSPLATAAAFAAVGLALDAIVIGGLVARDLGLLASATQTWIPYVLAFVAAVVVGAWPRPRTTRTPQLRPARSAA